MLKEWVRAGIAPSCQGSTQTSNLLVELGEKSMVCKYLLGSSMTLTHPNKIRVVNERHIKYWYIYCMYIYTVYMLVKHRLRNQHWHLVVGLPNPTRTTTEMHKSPLAQWPRSIKSWWNPWQNTSPSTNSDPHQRVYPSMFVDVYELMDDYGSFS